MAEPRNLGESDFEYFKRQAREASNHPAGLVWATLAVAEATRDQAERLAEVLLSIG